MGIEKNSIGPRKITPYIKIYYNLAILKSATTMFRKPKEPIVKEEATRRAMKRERTVSGRKPKTTAANRIFGP